MGSLLSFDEILKSTGGELLSKNNFCVFESVATDSRLCKKNSLFVPLIGENLDGHNFIAQAIKNGASAVFVSKKDEKIESLKSEFSEVAFVFVQNTMKALQDAAAFYVGKFPNLKKVCVTGSSGKTTTKEFLFSMLSKKFRTIATEGNLNSETGLPLSVFKIRAEHEACVFELGMNRKDEIKEISSVLKANFAVITNIGTAHIGRLGSKAAIAAEKKHAFDFVQNDGIALIPKEDEFAKFLSEGVKGKVEFFSLESERAKFISDEGLLGSKLSICGIEANLPLPGKHIALDAISAALLALDFGVSAEQIKEAIESTKPLFGRAEILRGNFTVIKDCYNANPESMAAALKTLSSVSGRKIAVLGEMLELGEFSEAAHKKIAHLAEDLKIDCTVFVGGGFQNVSCKNSFKIEGRSEDSIREAAEILNRNVCKGDTILIKGSRAVSLERILPFLEM